MAKVITFKVSKKGHDQISVTREFPENLEDPAWENAVSNPAEDVHNLAESAWVVKCQAGARARIELGPEAVQEFVSSYKLGTRSSVAAAPTLGEEAIAQGGFSEEQLAILRAAGVAVPAAA